MSDTDGSRSPRRSTRAVLLVGILAGLSSTAMTLSQKPDQLMLASDVYLYAARALLEGGDVYAVTPPGRPGYHYLYPPIVLVAFLPHAALGTELAAFVLQSIGNVVASVGTAVVIWRALGRRGVAVTRLDRALLVGFVLGSAYSFIPHLNGQVTTWLAFAFAVGFDALDRRRDGLAGVAFGAAALVKVFPAALGLWLLRRRAWRGVAAATAVGTGGLLLGVLAFGPDLTVTYLTDVLVGRFEGASFDGRPDPARTVGGVRRQFAALLGVGPPLLTPLALAALAPFVAALYRRVDTDLRRQAAALGTVLATLLFMPLQPLYFLLIVFPLVLLLSLLPAGPARTVLLAGALLTFVTGGYESTLLFVDVLPLPAGIEAAAIRAAEAVFTVVLPQTAGMWLLLIGCVLVQFRGDEPSSSASGTVARS